MRVLLQAFPSVVAAVGGRWGEVIGMPVEFYQAAGEIYRRMAAFKGAPELPGLDEVLAALLANGENDGRG
jgi:hypothetical protein